MNAVRVAVLISAMLLGGVNMSQGARILSDEDLSAGQKPRVGDTVILSDFSRCYPRSGLRTESVKGKWWLRPYRTASGQTGTMLCVEERDMDNPQSCLVPALTYHLNLEGIYDIWVGTYRPIFYGGVDIKLTRDKVYGTIDPREEEITGWPPGQAGNLVEMFYKTADLTGQRIHLRQPHGTYQSLWWGLCNAHLAYLRLVCRDPNGVEQGTA